MADKNVEKLANLFHDQSKFLQMSGTWKKQRRTGNYPIFAAVAGSNA